MLYKTPLDLTKKLVSLPSFVDGKQDETSLADFLYDFVRQEIPGINIEKQLIRKGSPRYNLIIKGKNTPKLLALGHLDTVQPKAGWETDPLEPTIKGDRLYGLGTADMKGAMAAMLWTMAKEQRNISFDNLMVLLYVDEEYDFKGMLRFLRDKEVTELNPDIILSMEGNLEVSSGCRGLIELKLLFKGLSGHSMYPEKGVNAIAGALDVARDLERELAPYGSDEMGKTTVNPAGLQGGCLAEDGRWLRQGNIIPDSAELLLEVRTADKRVDAAFVLETVEQLATKRGLRVENFAITHDIKPWLSAFNDQTVALLEDVYSRAGVSFTRSPQARQSYIDAQMVAERLGAPAFMIGGSGENQHAANENIPVANPDKCAAVYRELLRKVL